MVRFKQRYFLAEVTWAKSHAPVKDLKPHLLQALQKSVSLNFGDYGAGCTMHSVNGLFARPAYLVTGCMI
jgi:hypothetical protein